MRRFSKDRRGSLALNFAIMLPLFVIVVGSAVDFARSYTVREQLQNAVDAATLAATRMLALEPETQTAELMELVQAHLDASEVARDQLLTCDAPQMTVDRVEVITTVTIDCTLQTIFPLGFGEFEFQRQATSDFDFDQLEVAFMIDVSGSMRGNKLRDLKAAVRTAMDIFLNESRSDVRIAFAPYSTALNAGDFAVDAAGDPREWTTNAGVDRDSGDCVSERRGDNAFTDAPPSVELLGRPRIKDNWDCNTSSIVPLTSDIDVLDDAVETWYADGRTAGQLGIAWAWYLVSPDWATFWAPVGSAPRPTETTRRAVIIMTDGMFNERYVSQNGNSTTQSARLCENMKTEGVLVFSVGFQAPSGVQGTLRDCATIPTYYFNSSTGAQLENAYRSIAEELVSHTLTR